MFQKSFPARGLAIGDYNNDGRIDVLIGNNGGAPVLLKNNAGEGNHWIGVLLQGTTCNRDAIGATHHLVGHGDDSAPFQVQRRKLSVLARYARSAWSRYRDEVDWIEIKWPAPSGRVERLTDVPIDRYVTIVEGQGRINA